jgi:transcription antitermination protein NusB
LRSRSKARAWALRALYAWEARGEGVTLPDVAAEVLEGRNLGAEARDYLQQLLRSLGPHRREIDDAITGALTNWRLERLSAIDRNILRIAAAEMLYLDAVPRIVSIQEAMALAERYGTAESPRFVNGVLDALRRSLEPGPEREGERP